MHVRHDSAQIAQWRWCAACRSHSSAQVVQARTHDSSKGCTTRWSHWPARERIRAVTSQMSAHVWQSAMQTRIARTSSSMRSESAQAMQVCTQLKEASIAAATSTRSSGGCWGKLPAFGGWCQSCSNWSSSGRFCRGWADHRIWSHLFPLLGASRVGGLLHPPTPAIPVLDNRPVRCAVVVVAHRPGVGGRGRGHAGGGSRRVRSFAPSSRQSQ